MSQYHIHYPVVGFAGCFYASLDGCIGLFVGIPADTLTNAEFFVRAVSAAADKSFVPVNVIYFSFLGKYVIRELFLNIRSSSVPFYLFVSAQSFWSYLVTSVNKKELDARVQRAVDNFMEGYGCCQSVVAAFADLYGVSDELAKRIGAGFGGGVGRMRMMCGAVSGIVTLVGLDCGQTEGDDREGKSACYKVVQELLAKSKEQNGSLICAEILGLKGYEKAHSSYEASPRTAEYYKSRPCAAKVESAARIFAEYLQKKQSNEDA